MLLVSPPRSELDRLPVASSGSMADQEASGENKPQPKQEGQIINLIVKDQMGAEVHFKVKSHTKLEKVGTTC